MSDVDKVISALDDPRLIQYLNCLEMVLDVDQVPHHPGDMDFRRLFRATKDQKRRALAQSQSPHPYG